MWNDQENWCLRMYVEAAADLLSGGLKLLQKICTELVRATPSALRHLSAAYDNIRAEMTKEK